MKLPTVSLVGSPNVGKSTIFNRLVGKKISIVEDIPGVTRDRIYGKVNYNDYKFNLIDTGGIGLDNSNFNDEIKMQVEIAINESDIVVFIVDGKNGIKTSDYMVRDMLKKVKNRVIIAINKIDNKQSNDNMYDFYELGFDNYINISGEHNIGISELLDLIVCNFNKLEDIVDEEDVIKFAVIGRPNVGKSSLINALLNENKLIVSDVSGTTRDAVDTPFVYEHKKIIAIDTAGIKKSGKIYENIEKYSMLRSFKAISRTDVCVIVINAMEGIIEYDKHIAGMALEEGKAVVIVVNKWDMVSNNNTIKEYTKLIRNEFQFMTYANVVFLSALTKKRIHTLMPEIINSYNNSKREVKTSILNNIIMDAVELNPPPSYKGRRLKIYYSAQTGIMPPKITIQVNNKKLINFSYPRYIENKIRESIDFRGTPIILQFKQKGEQ